MKHSDVVATESVNEIIGKNIETIGSLHRNADGQTPRHQKALERLTLSLGSAAGVYTALAVVFMWILLNFLLPHPFDPWPCPFLQGLVTIAAFFTSLMVLARQSRLGSIAAKQAHLELQVNLLTEQKITKLIALVEELRCDLPDVRNREDPVAQSMARTANPEEVLSALEEANIDMLHYERHLK